MAKSHDETYYSGLSVFEARSNQQAQNALLLEQFLRHFRQQVSQAIRSDSIDDTLKGQLGALIQKPLNWMDIGCGDGVFTEKLLQAIEASGLPLPDYEGYDIHRPSLDRLQQRLGGRYPMVKTACIDGFAHIGRSEHSADIISGIQSLYFVDDMQAFRDQLHANLKPTGLGFFIHNRAVSDAASKELLGPDAGKYTLQFPVEVYFPPMGELGWKRITEGKNIQAIQDDPELMPTEKEHTLITKKLIEGIGGNPTESAAGQALAKLVKSRIEGDEYGPPGHYITANKLVMAFHPQAPRILKHIVEESIRQVALERAQGAALS